MTDSSDVQSSTVPATDEASDVKTLEVVGAVIIKGDKLLAAQRGPGRALAGYWEFPGGKVEPDEDQRESLKREIIEELGCEIEIGERIAVTAHDYEFGRIRLATYYATLRSGVPKALEHAKLRWIAVSDLKVLKWAPADMPTVDALLQRDDFSES